MKMSEEESYEFVKNTLKEEGIQPYEPSELEIIHSIEQCINCGLCINHCPVVSAVGVDRFAGPRSIAVEFSRTPPEFWSTGDHVYLCTGCGTCREVCPNNVDIPEIVNVIRARIFTQRPDLVPEALHAQNAIIHEYNLAFEPWEDIEDKNASRDMRLERLNLPYYKERIKQDAKVLFYPGCQAEERAQEVREAGKVILEHFGIDYTLLDELSCCGMPSRLIGDHEKAEDLARSLKEKIDALGVEAIVTTCAGCTSNLTSVAHVYGWQLPTYHMLEYLVEEIGIDRISEAVNQQEKPEEIVVTVHDPCHLIRHTSRRVMDYALDILKIMNGVEVDEESAHDSCCGGGGLVARHSPDVSKKVVDANVLAISKTEGKRVVTPCPLCTAQIEDNLFRSGIDIDVEDLSVFIARRLSRKED